MPWTRLIKVGGLLNTDQSCRLSVFSSRAIIMQRWRGLGVEGECSSACPPVWWSTTNNKEKIYNPPTPPLPRWQSAMWSPRFCYISAQNFSHFETAAVIIRKELQRRLSSENPPERSSSVINFTDDSPVTSLKRTVAAAHLREPNPGRFLQREIIWPHLYIYAIK